MPRYYRPELDVLRFFAFFLVFLSHVVPGDVAIFGRAHIPAGFANVIISMSAGGAFGVDLFFTLSSFLITTLLLRERKAYGCIDVRSFYCRRMLRIWPLYFVFLFVIEPVAQHVLPNEHLSLKYLVAFALLSGNWASAAWGYPQSVSTPLWSVSIEEQFYLSWPLVMRRWADHLGAVALALLALSPWIRIALLCSACALLTAVGHYEDFAGMKSLMTFPAVAAACGALMLGTLGIRMALDGRPLVRAFVYLGRISYGLYVFHSLFIVALDVPAAHEPWARLSRAAAALIGTVAAAAASYHLLEKPFLQWKEKFARVPSRPA